MVLPAEDPMAKKPTTTTSRTRKAPAGEKPIVAEPAMAMAASGHDVHGSPVLATGHDTISSGMDYAAHESMYHRFTDIVKWGIVGVVVLVLFLFIVIHPMVPPPAS